MGKKWGTYKKLHRWPGLIVSFVLLYYGFTGIIMNHRELFSGLDIDQENLPDNYEYRNWNNAALKGNLVISPDSILIYGNIGIWLTDSSFSKYTQFNDGFGKGIDNRKIFDVHQTASGDLYAATLFGLYGYSQSAHSWKLFGLDDEINRFTAISSIGDTVYAISRSSLFAGKSQGTATKFEKITIPAPEGYDEKITLFETIWQIHSGEIMGLPGQLFVDILGIITIFLSVTGIIYFFFPDWIKRRTRKDKPSYRIVRISRWSLKWHNLVGAWTFILLIILFFTGMFLRPPLLIAIANAKVAPIKFSNLDQPNPWYDKLRDLYYDESEGHFLLSTSEGIYKMNRKGFRTEFFDIQPPVSVMGINSLERTDGGSYLVGSFTGLFLWNPENPVVINVITGDVYREDPGGRPIGEVKVTGTVTGIKGEKYVVDYDQGIFPLGDNSSFPEMPHNVIEGSKMSLWNVMLEIHTGRIFQKITGDFYILIVPLTGITGIMVVIAGYMLWRRKYRKKAD